MLSAVIICNNEAIHIRACILALQHVSDDIIVIDSGSTDDTVALAEQAGARVFHHSWEGYGANKNFGNQQAKNNWILSVDADEILSETLISEIKNLKAQEDHIYSLDRMTFYENRWIKHSGWYPDRVLRIFPKNVKWDQKKVHEILNIPSSSKIIHLRGKLEHYSYRSKEDHILRIHKYARLAAEELYASGKNITIAKRLFGPSFRFIKAFIIKQGFRDGAAGYQIARLDAEMIRIRIQHYDFLKNKGQ